jgi:outer membrane protein insertion porin family
VAGSTSRGLAFLLAGLPIAARAAEEAPPRFEVELRFEGNEEVGSGRLEAALSAMRADMRRDGVDQGGVDDAAYEIQRFLESEGYRSARAAAAFAREDARFTITFQVEEGPRSYMEGIAFTGNERFSSTDLEDCFVWPRSGFLGLGRDVLGRPVFTTGALEEGLACVVTRYQLDGWYFARAEPVFLEDAGERVRLRVDIEEGPRITLPDLPRLVGVNAFPEADVLGALDLKAGDMYVPRLPLVLQGKVLDFYRRRGYRFAEVSVERDIDRESREARLTLEVREGPLTRVDDVVLHGNKKTRDWVLRNRIRLEPGDIYDEEAVRESYRSLLRSDLFSSVNIDSRLAEGTEDRVILDVTVSERAKYRPSVLVGFGSYELLRGAARFENANVLGTGHRIAVEGKGSFRGYGGSAEYLNPFFFDDRLSHAAKGFFEHRENPSFTETQYGADTGLSYRVSDFFRTSLYYQLKESDVPDADEGIPPELVEDVFLSSIIFAGTVDVRNSIVDPDRGSTHRLTVEYSGRPLGSDLDFLRYGFSTSWVFPLGRRLRLIASARFGFIDLLAGTDVIPIQERYFLGGESTIRSFRQDEAGPQVNGDAIGGEAFTCYNLEVRFPLFVLEDLHGAAFFDAGTVNEDARDIGRGPYFLGVGGGIRYNTPIGPLRFDVGWNPDPEDQPSVAYQFALGYPF